MAGASEKKAAAARASASSFYLPIVMVINLVHILIRAVYKRDTFTRNQAILSVVLWALTAFAYNGIIEDHANKASAPKKTGKAGGTDPIAGGKFLDLLGLVVVVQFGSCLLSDKFYWLLAILPVWGAWIGYQTVYGVKNSLGGMAGGSTSAMEAKPEEVDEATAERRRKRAEKRRMKAVR
mmetsp:Transcript_40717/g.75382  ORF Transcript_40717/g.75382 Transcript_40717/m.75382 type:complete len:180 (-) Transcript_40717:128-667(-)|eukprot:CAMPEP_0197458986 /NCGR_PEP_ID=MMETSP1175-20131217/50133_1 /TAXON_ID=1003142 /ORGANISM="Triceratium dubium, Strain CCMP147" /LENGTH=179 /DNA_ID=CAMNT_0042993741 /DNA_START=66 /DNA_END=605 /DNA_ORIENTATION=+